MQLAEMNDLSESSQMNDNRWRFLFNRSIKNLSED